ncbi:MAG: serine/threonine-protein kinase [Nannocystales bacterium]
MSAPTQSPDDDRTPTLPAWVTASPKRVVPDRVGPFKVLEKIGAGGAGEVWAAYDEALDRRVALKLVRRRGVADQHETRLLREAHALAKLSHPNVVTVHDADKTQDYVYIAMELVEGGTLKSAFANAAHGPLTRLGWLLQAARGLQAAHDLGLVHRDFKPANALLGDDGRVRVADFGLARRAEPHSQAASTQESTDNPSLDTAADSAFSDLTITGAILGTPAYMSPEQRMAQRVTPASDQFSFCVVAWQALYGENPLAELNLAQWVAGDASLPHAPSLPGVPSSLAAVLRRGLEPSPNARYPSMTPILRALESATRPRRGWKSIAVTGAAGVLAASVAAAVLWPAPQECAVPRLGWTTPRHAATASALDDGTHAGQTAAALAQRGLRDFEEAWAARAQLHCERSPSDPSPCLERDKATYERVVAVLHRDAGRSHVPELLATLNRACQLTDNAADPSWIRLAQLWPELAAGNAQEALADSTRLAAILATRRQPEDPHLQSELARLRGAAKAQLGDTHEAVETLRVAYNIAERTGADAVAAAVAADLARLAAIDLGQPARGRVWLESAEALGVLPQEVHAKVAFVRGLLAAKENDWRVAATAFERSAALQENVPAYTDGPAEAWLGQAEALSRVGEMEHARRCASRAAERRDRLYGPTHPKARAARTLELSLQSL